MYLINLNEPNPLSDFHFENRFSVLFRFSFCTIINFIIIIIIIFVIISTGHII